MKCKSYNVFFEVVGSKTRMEILDLLMRKPMCVSDICSEMKEEQSKISHNIKKLKDCHFIEAQKEGKKRIYSLNKQTILPLMKLVDEHVHRYCGNECAVRQ